MKPIKIGKIRLDTLEKEDSAAEHFKISGNEKERRLRSSYEEAPQYDWEKQFEHEGIVSILEREAVAQGNKSIKDIGLYIAEKLEKYRRKSNQGRKQTLLEWTQIMQPNVGAGFNSKARTKIKRKIRKNRNDILKQIESSTVEVPESQDDIEGLTQSFFRNREESHEIMTKSKIQVSTATKKTKEGFAPVKFGRSCNTCRYGDIKRKSQFGVCRRDGSTKWAKAHCNQWDLKTIQEHEQWLNKHEKKHLETKESTDPGKRGRRYKTRSRKSSADIFIGKICFTCKHRGDQASHERISCEKRQLPGIDTSHYMVWQHAICENYKTTNDNTRFGRMKSNMKKSGADVNLLKWKRIK